MSVVRFQTFPSLAAFFYLSLRAEKYDFSQATVLRYVAVRCEKPQTKRKHRGRRYVHRGTNIEYTFSRCEAKILLYKLHFIWKIPRECLRQKFMFRNLRIRVELRLLTSVVVAYYRTCKC